VPFGMAGHVRSPEMLRKNRLNDPSCYHEIANPQALIPGPES
jgi:hypothetical protein